MACKAIWVVTATMVVLGGPALAGPADRDLPQDINFRTERGDRQPGVRCAAPKVSQADKARVDAQLRAFREASGNRGSKSPTPTPTPNPGDVPRPKGKIPVAFHVVYKDSKTGPEGLVDQATLQAQIDVLNAAFAGTEFQFYLAKVDYTNNSKWFGNCYSYSTEYAMKRALAVDPAHVLNIYTCKPQRGILGYAYYPWSFGESAEADFRHGVVALYASLPGGSAAPYDAGDTVTHETGHYLGLYHTFEGGCADPGDYVDDTPAEASPDYYCDKMRDSCPAEEGRDPVSNYMDYGDDYCIEDFTPGQAIKMKEAVKFFRPTLDKLLFGP